MTTASTRLEKAGAAVSAVMPFAAQQQTLPVSPGRPQSPRRPIQHLLRRFRHPVLIICAVQAALSLTLVWSNTAYIDEADYLWVGHLEIAHWLHGTSWPSAYAYHVLSGSPVIYPPLGALADSVGGLAGARILSLVFTLGATVLLYLTASRLLDRSGAIAAAALWALSEPAIRLAFATYDPLSVLLTALSAWLIVQASYRRRPGAFVTAAAAALALANATAYSGIVIDPVVIAFAFLAWLPSMRARQASLRAACLAAGSAVFFWLLMTASRSWAGIMFTVLYRSGSDHQGYLLVLRDIWGYSGLIICLAVIGVVIAVGAEGRQRAALLTLLGCTVLVVPAAQLHERTGWSLDKHLAYGIWFAAIAAGYACSKLIRRLPEVSTQLAAICCVLALAYPAATSWESAWQVYHAWPNARSFINAFKPVAAQSHGFIYIADRTMLPSTTHRRVTGHVGLGPVTWPSRGASDDDLETYYAKQLQSGDYGIIVLFYPTTFSSAPDTGGFSAGAGRRHASGTTGSRRGKLRRARPRRADAGD